MDTIPRWNVVHKLQKRKLLIAINCVAGLSIFFFGYDQGMMGGVNNAVNYYQTTMKFGVQDPNTLEAIIQKPLLQGGIVHCTSHFEPMCILMSLGLCILSWYSIWLPHWRLVR